MEEEELELLEEELELLLGLGSNSNESPPPAELLDESPSSTSWYRLTRVGRFVVPYQQPYHHGNSQVGLAFLVAYQGNAELLLGVRGWLVLVNNVFS